MRRCAVAALLLLAACGGATEPGGASLAGVWTGTVGTQAIGMRLDASAAGTAIALSGPAWELTPAGDTTFGLMAQGSAHLDDGSVTLAIGTTPLETTTSNLFQGHLSDDNATMSGEMLLGPTASDTIRGVIFHRGS